MQHYNQIKMFPENARLQACDFSFYLDRAYVDVTLSEQQRDAFIAVYDQAIRELGTPSLLVYLRCGDYVQLGRVRRRRRDAEKGITLDYLRALNRALESHVSEIRKNVNVVEIDSEIRDFARDEKATREVLEEIYQALGAEGVGDVLVQGGYTQPR
jgi:deoxyadenosine/deoxycytidine kinase